MHERVRSPIQVLKYITAPLAVLALSGCGGPTYKSSETDLRACETNDTSSPFTALEGSATIDDTAEFVADVTEKVEVLHARLLETGDSIDLPRYASFTEIKGNEEQLTLYFPNKADFGHIKVRFGKTDDGFILTPGTIACTAEDGIHPNGVVESLDMYLEQTASIHTGDG